MLVLTEQGINCYLVICLSVYSFIYCLPPEEIPHIHPGPWIPAVLLSLLSPAASPTRFSQPSSALCTHGLRAGAFYWIRIFNYRSHTCL